MADSVKIGDLVKLRGGKVAWTVDDVIPFPEAPRATLINKLNDNYTPHPGALVSDLKVIGNSGEETT